MRITTQGRTRRGRGQWAARCGCYAGHSSSSGRCNNRNVFDPSAREGDAVHCADCAADCWPHVHKSRNAVALVERLAHALARNANGRPGRRSAAPRAARLWLLSASLRVRSAVADTVPARALPAERGGVAK